MTGPRILDCRGRPCPIPVIELAKALPTVKVGAELEVWADDPAARFDIPAWCAMRGQEYAGARELPASEAGGTADELTRRPPGAAYLVRRRG